MRRILGLSLLAALLSGCVVGLFYEEIRGAYDPKLTVLRNTAVPGDPNRDLVPYQARRRDYAACQWATILEYDENETALYACMAEKGWR